jgi:hypothetical protein
MLRDKVAEAEAAGKGGHRQPGSESQRAIEVGRTPRCRPKSGDKKDFRPLSA